MHVTFLGWVGLIVGLVILLLQDLFVLHRGAHEVPMGNALWSTVGFVAIALAFGVGLALREGGDAAGQFFAGYALAYSAAQLLGQIPLTPGGLGVVEAGLTGTLALAAVPAAPAALATLADRLVSYWLPLPAGLAAWVLHRRRYGIGSS